MKGQRKGVRSTKVKPAGEIKIEPGQEDAPPKPEYVKQEQNNIS